jgi:hypothetical protein
MMDRVISHRLPVCPGHDSRFTIRHHGTELWVFCKIPGGDPVPADAAHPHLVELVNALKQQHGNQPGGSFSINEHGQVIARMHAPSGAKERAHHVVALDLQGNVMTYREHITFRGGLLDPMSTPTEGEPWTGPLCGMSYTFAAPNNPKPPTRNLDEIWVEIEGENVQLSRDARLDPYPPPAGPLVNFLKALRRQLPSGGPFRVNEHGRAFTSDENIFIGIVPSAQGAPEQWFKPLNARS